MKVILDLLAAVGFGKMFSLLGDLLKGYCLGFYIGLVEHVRGLFLVGLLTILCFSFLTAGFVLFHAGLFMYLPWETADKAVLLMALSAVYFLLPLFLMGALHSRKNWLKMSGAKKMLDDLAAKK